MKIRSIINRLKLAYTFPEVFLKKKQYIFVISHMRAYTTLTSHILGSHPEIDGYTEHHLDYTKPSHLRDLRYRVSASNDGTLPGKFVLDKLVHNYNVSPAIREKNHVAFLLTIREPKGTFESIYRMQRDIEGVSKPDVRGYILEYYKRRLGEIQQFARQLDGDYFFFEGDRLIQDSPSLLHDLTEYLQLASPLMEEYQVFRHTGTRGYGDPSGSIKEGKIAKRNHSKDKVELPADVLEEAQSIYREAVEEITALQAK